VATVSDQLKRSEHLSPEERQTSFDDMITLVLDAVTGGTVVESTVSGG
jgi:purine-nucleoside phosphorylase